MILDGNQQPQQEVMPAVSFVSTQQVVMQVGEKYFGVAREVLQKQRHSLFEDMLEQFDKAQKAGQGGVISLQHRSPAHFPVILTYLNQGLEGLARLHLKDADLQDLEALLIESEYYRLPQLSAFVKAQLKPELTREVVQHLLKRPTAPRDFMGARLVGLDLSKLNFVSVEVKGKESKYLPTVVHHCDFKPQFTNANLQWTDFSHSLLQGSNFQGAKLSYTNLTGANLTGSNFEGAKLSKVNFTKADLSNIDFQKVAFSQCDFSGAIFTNVNASNVMFSAEPSPAAPNGSSSSSPAAPQTQGCDFQKAHFENSRLAQASFARCDLKEAKFVECQLSGADFSNSQLEGAEFVDCDLSGAYLAYANLKSAKLHRCKLDTSTLNHANLSFAQLFGSTFTQTQLVAANLQCSELFEFSLDDTDQHLVFKNHASFIGATFRFAQLQGVDFHKVDCTGADFRDANLTNAIMKDTILEKANLEGATLKRRTMEDFEAQWVVSKKGKTMEDGKFPQH